MEWWNGLAVGTRFVNELLQKFSSIINVAPEVNVVNQRSRRLCNLLD